MNVGVCADWIYVQSNQIPQQELAKLRVQYDDQATGMRNSHNVWQYADPNGNYIAIPRFSDFGKYLLKNNLVTDNRCEGEAINVELVVPPRDHHQEKAIQSMLLNTNGICCAKTAFGKTYVASNLISQLKRKTIIFVHKTDLANQWKKDLLTYLTLKDEDIYITDSEDLGFDKPIIIVTVQNIADKAKREKWELRDRLMKANFGVAIYDECHVTSATLGFVQSTRWVFCKRVYGLSATPKRGDDFDNLLKWTIGDIVYIDERPMMNVIYSFVPYHAEIPQKTRYWMMRNQKGFITKYTQWLAKQDIYNETCAHAIARLINMGRKILVVGSFKAVLDSVDNKLKELYPELSDRIVQCHGTTKMTHMDLDKDLHDCVITTNKYFSDGLSVAWLDTLVCITPPPTKSLISIPQLVGRLVRDYPGKRFCFMLDMFNAAFDIDISRKAKRQARYSELGYIEVWPKDPTNHVEDCFNQISSL